MKQFKRKEEYGLNIKIVRIANGVIDPELQ